MGRDPWVKFYHGDWLTGTSGLTAAERGVYITVVALIYEIGGPVALDHVRLARRCGLPKAGFQRALGALVAEGKLVETPGGLMNERCARELEEREGRSQSARNAASQRYSASAESYVSDRANGFTNARSVRSNLEAAHGEKTVVDQASPAASASSAHCQSESESESESEESSFQSDSTRLDDDFQMIWKAAKLGRSASAGDRREVERWKAQGVTTAAAVRAIGTVLGKRGNGEPVRSLRYFRDEVERAAKADSSKIATWKRMAGRAALDDEAQRRAMLEHKAAWINGGRPVPGNLCSPGQVDELIALGLITAERAREVGLQ